MMNKVNVEKDVLMPHIRVINRYPYKEMEIGDSFFLDDISIQLVCNNNYRASKKFNMKFVARREGNGVRVWRTA
jgi:hypothetical protein